MLEGQESDADPLSPDARGILATRLHADGRHNDLLYVDGGPSTTGTVGKLRMKGREVFRHAVNNLAAVMEETLAIAGLLTVVIGVGGGAGVYFAADRQENSVARNEVVAAVLDIENDGPAENFLIVGSDSRSFSRTAGAFSQSMYWCR